MGCVLWGWISRGSFPCGELSSLTTGNFVQEGYLAYIQVPDSDPPSQEFLWGTRAHTQMTKVKILEFFANTTGSNPRGYPFSYGDALRDQTKTTYIRIAQQVVLLL